MLILYSFNGQGVGGFPPHHLTLDWYRILFADGAIWDSVLNSLEVAFAAMAISLTFGIPAAWRSIAHSFRARHSSGDWCCSR